MSIVSCTCANPAFGRMGRDNCPIEMRVVAFPIFFPRFKADGTRNTINLASVTLGSDVQALIAASTATLERLYPFPRVEEPTWSRTETGYETASSTQKYKVFGLGGVYTFSFQTWGKDASFQQMREALNFGCSDLDMLLATVDGNLWGVKDSRTDTVLRGYELNTETFDSYVEFANATTVAKGMFSVDLDNVETVENSYAILADEMIDTGGVKSTSLSPLIGAYQTGSAVTNTTCQSIVFTGGGSAGDATDVVGLLVADFTVENTDVPAGDTAVSLVESPDGTYVITTSAMTATENYKITCTKAGYDIADGTFVAV
jgi:hypothetical protein